MDKSNLDEEALKSACIALGFNDLQSRGPFEYPELARGSNLDYAQNHWSEWQDDAEACIRAYLAVSQGRDFVCEFPKSSPGSKSGGSDSDTTAALYGEGKPTKYRPPFRESVSQREHMAPLLYRIAHFDFIGYLKKRLGKERPLESCPLCKRDLRPEENWWYDEYYEQSMCPTCGKEAQTAVAAVTAGVCERLRLNMHATPTGECICDVCMLHREAIDEIERLTAERNEAKDRLRWLEANLSQFPNIPPYKKPQERGWS